MRLIDADALKSALEIEQYNDYDDLLRTERLIDNAPTIERLHGEWIQDDKFLRFTGDFKCSNCNVISGLAFPYCPNCGADMRNRGEGE